MNDELLRRLARRSRQSAAGGLLLFDDRGQERGSFATFKSGYVGMTLDSDTSMVTTLVAGRQGGSGLRMAYGTDAIDIRADDDGPRVHVMRGKQVAFHAPAEVNPAAMPFCGELRGAIGKASREQILDACRERASEEACQACLGGK